MSFERKEYNYSSNFASSNLALEIETYINKETVIVCIGTDKCIGDCLGPLSRINIK